MSVQSILNTAAQYLGTNDFNNFCEAFVEQATQGHTGVYPSAIQAWMAQRNNAVVGTQGIQPGDTVYFSADKSNGGYGHTGIYIGNNQFISATYNGVKTADLSQWQKSTGQKLLGYVPSGQAGRGVAQFAMQNGKMLQGQMQEASQTPDQLMAQKLQQFRSQQQIAQSQRLLDQASSYRNQSQNFLQMAQQPKQQVQLPTAVQNPAQQAIQAQQQQQTPSYPYGQYLNQTNPAPTLSTPPGTSGNTQAQQPAFQTPTDFTPTMKPLQMPNKQYQFGNISTTLQ